MGDDQFGNKQFLPERGNSRHPFFRNSRQYGQGPRRQRQVYEPVDDQNIYQNNNYASGVDGHFGSISYHEPKGGINYVDNFQGKRNVARTPGRLRANSYGYKNDSRHRSDGSNSCRSTGPSYVTGDNCNSYSNSERSEQIPRKGDVDQQSSTNSVPFNTSNHVTENKSSDLKDQMGLVVGGRYMRRNNGHPSRTENNIAQYSSGQKYSYDSNPSAHSYQRDIQQQNSDFRTNSYSSSDNKRQYNFRGRYKQPLRTKADKRCDLNDSTDNLSASETVLNDYDGHQSSSKSSSESSYTVSHQKYQGRGRGQQSSNRPYIEEDEATQTDRLTAQLHNGECECTVCCESIRNRDQVWCCNSCYHVFHLRCIRKWARSPAAIIEDSGWRCPTCQNISPKVPFSYFCFCGKRKDPEVTHHLTPHSCGEVCRKERPSELCPHRCNILCHPGPCPPCTATITRPCGCGKTKKTIPCRQQNSLCCDAVCDKILNCGVHRCNKICHVGDCGTCAVMQKQVCFCGKAEQEVLCFPGTANCTQFMCESVCEKKLTCGHHYCKDFCHPGPCAACHLTPEAVEKCPCGKTPLKWLYEKNEGVVRTSCIDTIPVCQAVCGKMMKCGPKENLHLCDFKCHSDECPPCPLSTIIKCRCGSVTKDMPCVEYILQQVFLCEKRCSRRKDCGRHKCLSLCCLGLDHICELVCNKKLNCGLHLCEEKCHNGNCPPCRNVSFDELTCHCGVSVLYPPIHCGTKPPECRELCTREHNCDHPVQHSCHKDDSCPPCTVLTVKWCFGKHMQRKNVQCFLEGISCGHPCDKPLPCNVHKCQDICHQGPCLKNNSRCTQPCTKLRPDCDHPCNAPCHEGPCPDTPCKSKMSVSCPCKNRSEVMLCSDNSKAYHLVSMSMLASKMQDIKLGQSVNMSDVLGKKNKLNNRLQCNEECAVLERNKRLAVALQIQNPDLSCRPGPPGYSEFLKDEARKSPQFVNTIYDKLTELVQLAKESKKKSRSHAFPPMNRDQRRVIHEMAEFFGCESQSYDEEPKKSVTITAFRDKSWLPFMSIMAAVQREMGQRKGPTPMITKAATSAVQSVTPQKERTIDYFDFKDDS